MKPLLEYVPRKDVEYTIGPAIRLMLLQGYSEYYTRFISYVQAGIGSKHSPDYWFINSK